MGVALRKRLGRYDRDLPGESAAFDGRHILAAEVVEVSAVAVPAHPDALTLAGMDSVEARHPALAKALRAAARRQTPSPAPSGDLVVKTHVAENPSALAGASTPPARWRIDSEALHMLVRRTVERVGRAAARGLRSRRACFSEVN